MEKLGSPTGSITLQGGTLVGVLSIGGMAFSNFGALERSVEKQQQAQASTNEQVAVLAGKFDVLTQAIGSVKELRETYNERKAAMDEKFRRIESRLAQLEAKHARRGR